MNRQPNGERKAARLRETGRRTESSTETYGPAKTRDKSGTEDDNFKGVISDVYITCRKSLHWNLRVGPTQFSPNDA